MFSYIFKEYKKKVMQDMNMKMRFKITKMFKTSSYERRIRNAGESENSSKIYQLDMSKNQFVM